MVKKHTDDHDAKDSQRTTKLGIDSDLFNFEKGVVSRRLPDVARMRRLRAEPERMSQRHTTFSSGALRGKKEKWGDT